MSRRKAAADKQEPRSLKTKQWMDVRTVVRRRTSEVRKKENAKSEDPTRLTTVVWLTAEHMTLVKRKQNEQYIPKQRV
jgi:hypothetical protein